jgi:hypothetical protein
MIEYIRNVSTIKWIPHFKELDEWVDGHMDVTVDENKKISFVCDAVEFDIYKEDIMEKDIIHDSDNAVICIDCMNDNIYTVFIKGKITVDKVESTLLEYYLLNSK